MFSLGVSSRLSTYTEGSYSSFSPVTSIQHFAFGLSFQRYFGLAFGVQPYSRRGYSFTTGAFVDTDSMAYSYDGSGSISKAFMGFSSDIIHFDSTRLSVGINAGYLFGNVTNSRKAQLYGSTAKDGGVGLKTYDVRSFHYDIGMYFKHQFNPNHELGLYATLDPLQNMKSTYTEEIYFASDINDPNTYTDTNYYNYSETGRLTNAPKMTLGLSYVYRLKDNNKSQHKLHPEIGLYASYSMTNWSKYENTFDSDSSTFLNTSKLSVGFQFIHET